jgi:hypothetical protein
MYHIRKVILFLLTMKICVFSHVAALPPMDSGIARFDYFTQSLPPESRGIYAIASPDKGIKYIGSSRDIDKRLSYHHKRGVLEPVDTIWALIFHNGVRQETILAYERNLIKKFSPPFNKHTGAPGRSWRSDQISKLQTFYVHNCPLLQPQGKVIISDLLSGKILCGNEKMAKNLLRIMGLFL